MVSNRGFLASIDTLCSSKSKLYSLYGISLLIDNLIICDNLKFLQLSRQSGKWLGARLNDGHVLDKLVLYTVAYFDVCSSGALTRTFDRTR